MSVDLERFARLRATWQEFVPASPTGAADPAGWPRRMAHMQTVQSNIATAGGWSAGPSTLMSVLGISRREVLNCRVVTWLHDPLARHGIGASMIAALGEALGAELAAPQHARCDAEVSRARSRADVVISGAGDAWTIVIEAKIGAGEGPDQGWRLEQDWLGGEERVPTTYFVFLTTGGARVPLTARRPERWVPIRWSWIADQAAQLLDAMASLPDRRSLEARHALEEWITAARRSLQ